MKIDRRSFIALGLGVAAGTAFTPVPWKLTDDIAIWTQNWPWTPVPKQGADYYRASVCTLCPGACGIAVRKVVQRAVKIEGLSDYPVNQGSLCPLGVSGLQFLYGPSRVKAPIKRGGERGEGKWQEVSWEEALKDLTGKLAEIRENEKPQSLVWIGGDDRGTVPQLIQRFMDAYGSPNFIRPPSANDAFEMAASLMQGAEGQVGFDIENADYVLSFGTGVLEGWGSPARLLNVYGKTRGKKRWVQVEPRLSDTAAKADEWVSVKVGTEGALAMGIAHVLVKEQLYDQSFVNGSGFGFEDWTDEAGNSHKGFKSHVLENFSPEQVAKITGTDPKRVVTIARSFARAKNPVAVGGRGEGRLPLSLNEAMAVYALNALVGNINQQGGTAVIPAMEYAKWPEVKYDKTASQGLQQPRIDGAGTGKYPEARYLLHRLPAAVRNADGDSPVQALFVSDANPLYTLPDTEATKAAFDRIPLIVSFSAYLDETAAYADYVLPNHCYLERYEDVQPPAGTTMTVVGLSRPVVSPLYDTRHTGDVVIQMAKMMPEFVKNAFPWKDYQGFLETALKDHWKKLEDQGYAEVGQGSGRGFNTPSGKFEFAVNTAAENGKASRKMPDYTRLSLEGEKDAYPLVLIPYDTIRITSGATGNPPFMTKTVDTRVLEDDTSYVEINPETGRKLGYENYDRVVVSTPRGKAEVKLRFYEGIEPGVIAMPRGLGHSAYSRYLAGKGVNFNSLIGPADDPASGLNAAWGVRANISRA
jgi:anaerobic selenocysteine-containing dehydrogenase